MPTANENLKIGGVVWESGNHVGQPQTSQVKAAEQVASAANLLGSIVGGNATSANTTADSSSLLDAPVLPITVPGVPPPVTTSNQVLSEFDPETQSLWNQPQAPAPVPQSNSKSSDNSTEPPVSATGNSKLEGGAAENKLAQLESSASEPIPVLTGIAVSLILAIF